MRTATVAGAIAASLLAVAPAARALPPPAPPRSAPSSSPTPAVPGTTLPFGSPLFFVLDDKVDSGTTVPGTKIRMHLKSPLVVNGIELAPAGTPASLIVLSTRKAESGDIDGAVAVHLDPLPLPGRGLELPMRAIHEYLTIELTAGQESTRSTTDTLADIFVPYHVLYHALRPGRQFVMPAGSFLRAQTAATVDATNAQAVVLSTPLPFTSTYDTPHADLTAAPIYTPAPERPRPLPKGKPTLPPTPKPTPTPSAEPSPVASPGASPAPADFPSAAASPTAAAPLPPPPGAPSPSPSSSGR